MPAFAMAFRMYRDSFDGSSGVPSVGWQNTSEFVANEELVFLQPAAYDGRLTIYHGEVIGREITTTHGPVGSPLL